MNWLARAGATEVTEHLLANKAANPNMYSMHYITTVVDMYYQISGHTVSRLVGKGFLRLEVTHQGDEESVGGVWTEEGVLGSKADPEEGAAPYPICPCIVVSAYTLLTN